MQNVYNYNVALPNNALQPFRPRFNVSVSKNSEIIIDCTVYENLKDVYKYLNASLVPIRHILAWELITLAEWHDTKTTTFMDCYSNASVFSSAWSLTEVLHLSDLISFVEEPMYSLVKITKAEDIAKALGLGYPVVVGGSVYKSFEDAMDSGVVPLPRIGESLLGGHAFCLIGYDAINCAYRAIANFGPSFGIDGDIIVASSYLQNLDICRDFFTVQPS